MTRREECIYFGGKEKSSIERHLYKIRFDGTGLQQITEQDGTHKIAFSKDGKYYFDTFANIATPPSVSLCTNEGKGKFVLWQSKTDKIGELGLVYPQLLEVAARDGFQMPAMISKPKDFDPDKKYPAIVYVYGGPSAPEVLNNWQSSIFTDQILLDNGFVVFRFDNRSKRYKQNLLEPRCRPDVGGMRT